MIRVLINEDEIQKRVRDLGIQISSDFATKGIQDVIVIGILKGSFIFMADLVRSLSVDCECEFLGVSSYGDETKSSGEVKLLHDASRPLHGKHVLVVEDIADTGLTLNFIQKTMLHRGVASLHTAVFLCKPEKLVEACTLDYIGFKVGSEFVVGYGLDSSGKYRNLPYVGVIS